MRPDSIPIARSSEQSGPDFSWKASFTSWNDNLPEGKRAGLMAVRAAAATRWAELLANFSVFAAGGLHF
jgi:hypothetical protein